MTIPILVAGSALVLVSVVFAIPHLLRVVPAGEQHVVHRFGRFRTVRRPGLRLRIPGVENVTVVPTRPFAVEFRTDAHTGDGASLRVEGHFELRVEQAALYVDHVRVVKSVGPGIARDVVLGSLRRRSEVDVLERRPELADEIRRVLDHEFHRLGVEVTAVRLTVHSRVPTPVG